MNEIVTTSEATTPTLTLLSFKADTSEGKKSVFNALTNAVSLSENPQEMLNVAGIIVRPAQRTDLITGEIVDCESATFITTDGDSYFSTSNGIVNCAKALMTAVDGVFPSEGITIKFTQRDLGRGRTLKGFLWM